MAREVDELFGEGPGAPKPRVRRVYALTVLGVGIAAVGLLCSSVPGGLVVLIAFLLVEREGDRVESGYLPADAGPVVARARKWAAAGMGLSLAMFLVQGVLMCTTSIYAPVFDAIATGIIAVAAPTAPDDGTRIEVGQQPAPGSPMPGPGVAPAPAPAPAPPTPPTP